MKRAFFTLLCVLLTIVTLLFVAFMVAVGAAHPAGFTWVDWSIIGGIVVFQMVFMLPSYVAIYWNQPQEWAHLPDQLLASREQDRVVRYAELGTSS